MAHPPKRLQSVLWSVSTDKLDLAKDKWYIIHQVLHYGTLPEITWLLKTYSKRQVIEVFLTQPAKLYSEKAFHFVKNYLLGLRNKDLDLHRYVTSISGPVRPRAADRL